MDSLAMKADGELIATLCRYTSQMIEQKAGAKIFRQGDEPRGFYLIMKGTLRLSLESSPRRIALERKAGEGCLVGLRAAISGCAYSLNCEVVENAKLAFISRRNLARLLQAESKAAAGLLDLLGRELQSACFELANSTRRDDRAISTTEQLMEWNRKPVHKG